MNAPQDKFHQVMTRLVDLMKHVVPRLAITKIDEVAEKSPQQQLKVTRQ
jgi:hypothetical protein